MQPVDAGITLAGENDAVLAAVRTIRRREIEAIHERQRDVITARERIGVRQRPFRRRTAARQSVERRPSIEAEIVAVRRVACHQSRPRILGIEQLLIKPHGCRSCAASRDERVHYALEGEGIKDCLIGDDE